MGRGLKTELEGGIRLEQSFLSMKLEFVRVDLNGLWIARFQGDEGTVE
jgi:hypothetical protein